MAEMNRGRGVMAFDSFRKRQLKDWSERKGRFQRSRDDVKALLARLECAEQVLTEVDDNGFTDKAIRLHTEWLASKGDPK